MAVDGFVGRESPECSGSQVWHVEGNTFWVPQVDVKHKWYAYYEKYRPRKPKYFNRVHTGMALHSSLCQELSRFVHFTV